MNPLFANLRQALVIMFVFRKELCVAFYLVWENGTSFEATKWLGRQPEKSFSNKKLSKILYGMLAGGIPKSIANDNR